MIGLIPNVLEERTDLEDKRSDALVNNHKVKIEISKDVSGLTNGAEGTIVYGMVEENHLPRKLDGVDSEPIV